MAVLGAMLLEEDAVATVTELLNETSFYKESHRMIFNAMLTLYGNAQPIDLVTLSEQLKKDGNYEKIGSSSYLTELAEYVPTSANVEYHAKIVVEKAQLRRIISTSTRVINLAFQSEGDADNILDEAEREIFEIAQSKDRSGFQHIEPVLHQTFEQIERFHNMPGGVTGVSSGYPSMDAKTSGFQKAELVILAARPSMGKTALALSIARNVAVSGKPVGFISLEMSANSLAMRLLCAEARVDAHAVRTGRLPVDDWQNLSRGVGRLAKSPLYIDDTPGLDVLQLRSRGRRLKAEKNIELLVVDYLQLMTGPRAENRQQEVSVISRSLKALAKELDLPVVALSQLSRAVEQRAGSKKPILSDLRESGSIEQDADVVMFVHREDYYTTEDLDSKPGDTVPADIIIAKQRNGPVGTIPLLFIKKYARFEERETHHGEEPDHEMADSTDTPF